MKFDKHDWIESCWTKAPFVSRCLYSNHHNVKLRDALDPQEELPPLQDSSLGQSDKCEWTGKRYNYVIPLSDAGSVGCYFCYLWRYLRAMPHGPDRPASVLSAMRRRDDPIDSQCVDLRNFLTVTWGSSIDSIAKPARVTGSPAPKAENHQPRRKRRRKRPRKLQKIIIYNHCKATRHSNI